MAKSQPSLQLSGHVMPDSLYQRTIHIHVVGCGGTGSVVVPGLVKIHRTLLALGHPGGLHVSVWDSDAVSESNTVRQNFYEADIGSNKADVMINRLNVAHAAINLNWTAMNRKFSVDMNSHTAKIVIGCVDSKASRRLILQAIQRWNTHCYWIDCGNKADFGQVVCGEFWPQRNPSNSHPQGLPQPRLPLVTELLPEIATGKEEDDTPSCSAVQSIQRQGVMTNQMCANWALSWLSEALRHGHIDWNGVFFNLAQGRVSSIPVNPDKWAAMGFNPSPRTSPATP